MKMYICTCSCVEQVKTEFKNMFLRNKLIPTKVKC